MSSTVRDLRSQVASHTTGETTTPPPPGTSFITPMGIFFLVCTLLLIAGYTLPLDRYITAKRGIGYLLGVVGGSAMLILLLYPARKRWRWLSFMGNVKAWFQIHMVLGLVGPIMILYHSIFSLGATNSNIALFCMLTVSGSGLIGRYLYTRIHFGLTDRATTLADLHNNAQRLRSMTFSVPFFPELLQRLENEEKDMLVRIQNKMIILRPLYSAWSSLRARQRLHSYVRIALRVAAAQSSTVSQQKTRLKQNTYLYIKQRLQATQQVANFKAYTQLFSLWHVLHLPLFFMLLIAGIAHVFAVHVY
jgi:hypothetical protein